MTTPTPGAEGLSDDAAGKALQSFLAKGGYLSHPDVQPPYNGIENGDTHEAWAQRFFKAAAKAAIEADRKARGGAEAVPVGRKFIRVSVCDKCGCQRGHDIGCPNEE